MALELRGRLAEPTLRMRLTVLRNALGEYAVQRGGYPPREALAPGGAFWRWRSAPRLTNPVSGKPVVLGEGPGNFDYAPKGTWGYSLRLHLYGGDDLTESDSGNL